MTIVRRYFVLVAVLFSSSIFGQEPNPQTIWDLDSLHQTPEHNWGETSGLTQEVYFTGERFNGKQTRVFAYVGRPKGDGPFPGIVLVHGGGGAAFQEWAQLWAERGYVSIAMDTSGRGRKRKKLPDGGPEQNDQTKFRNFDVGDTKNMWTYHAIADVILSHSLLLSLPQVDKDRTGVTGISWGGYLTCIVAGVDHRFKAAAPTYGCGFLHDNSVWKEKSFGSMTESSRERWIQLFDPGQHVGRTKSPILFLNGTNDFAYPLDSYRKTIEQVAPELVTTAVQLNLPHGHIFNFPIVKHFMDANLKNKSPLIQLDVLKIIDDQATAKITNGTSAVNSELLYTIDRGPWQQRKWKVLRGKCDDESISAKIPPDRPIAFYLQATDSRGLKTSTTHANLSDDNDLKNWATIPTPKLEQDFYDWNQRHADALRIKDSIDPKIVLLGDSITHMWGGRPTESKHQNGKDTWATLFGDTALNLGFGWDRTQNLLWRIDHGELDGLNPRAVVIHIGTNNLAGTKNHKAGTPEQIAKGISVVCKRVREKLPKAKLILMAVFPRGEKPTGPFRKKIDAINSYLPKMVQTDDAILINLTDKLLTEDGILSRNVAGDFLHPAEKGYAIWANAIEPFLK